MASIQTTQEDMKGYPLWNPDPNTLVLKDIFDNPAKEVHEHDIGCLRASDLVVVVMILLVEEGFLKKEDTELSKGIFEPAKPDVEKLVVWKSRASAGNTAYDPDGPKLSERRTRKAVRIGTNIYRGHKKLLPQGGLDIERVKNHPTYANWIAPFKREKKDLADPSKANLPNPTPAKPWKWTK